MSEKYERILQNLSTEPSWLPENESVLLEPFTYITETSGKGIRRKMIQAFNTWLKVPRYKVDIISRVVNMLHSASLMMDDVEDDSQLRRGVPVAHKIYGVPQTINSANYVYFLAYMELFALRSGEPLSSEVQQLDRLVTEELLNLHRGQGLDLFWRDSLTCPTEEQYIHMVNNKTGGLFRIAIRLMMANSSSKEDYVPLVNLISVYFQIRDDYMNLQSSEYESDKGFAEDLSEGKFSFPVLHAVRADASNRLVLHVLQQRPSTPTTKRHAVAYMRDRTHSFAYTLDVLRTLERKAREEVERLGGNGELMGLLDTLRVRENRE